MKISKTKAVLACVLVIVNGRANAFVPPHHYAARTVEVAPKTRIVEVAPKTTDVARATYKDALING